MVGSSEPKRKAILKGPQTRSWTLFIEAITADGRVLVPGIIFKGKSLQQQWFLQEFKQFADWFFITSPNGWTDDHIGVEWLKRVYLPQTKPIDESDARLIILDGHRNHTTVSNILKALESPLTWRRTNGYPSVFCIMSIAVTYQHTAHMVSSL